MQCYDCAIEQRTTPAVVMCSTCGAGLCLNHLVLGHADEWETTVGNPTYTGLSALLNTMASYSGYWAR